MIYALVGRLAILRCQLLGHRRGTYTHHAGTGVRRFCLRCGRPW